jgi:hypothetical protein
MPTAYSRPVAVEAVYDEIAKVRYQDNHLLGYVPVDEIEEGAD